MLGRDFLADHLKANISALPAKIEAGNPNICYRIKSMDALPVWLCNTASTTAAIMTLHWLFNASITNVGVMKIEGFNFG